MPPDPLDSYREKRDFGATPEPKPGARDRRAGARPRFVIQEHHATRLHWDLRLEHDGVLVSWALPRGIPGAPGDNRIAVRTEDHPLAYLRFAGEIPSGEYGAGTMTIWDHGTYEQLKWEPRKVEADLRGERVSGRYALFALGDGDDWMIHRMDPPADAAAEPMPDAIAPMLARAGALPSDPENWAFEVKWDGVRAICVASPGQLALLSRNLNDITATYPELGRLSRAIGHRHAVLDGEIVALDAAGKPDFGALQRRMHVNAAARARRLADAHPVRYMPFDLLWLDGHSLLERPYGERRAALATIGLDVPEQVVGEGAALLEATREQGLEGIVAKRLDSRYEPGRRSPHWLKITHSARETFVIGGWEPGAGRRADGVGSLLLGTPQDGGGLRFAGKVGTGFTDAELTRLRARLSPLVSEHSPFGDGPPPPRGARFVAPVLACEVEFRERTRDGLLRAPSYKGLRDDGAARLVIRGPGPRPGTVIAQVDGCELRLSNLDKVLWPATGTTKRELVEYLLAVAPALVGHLRDRQLTLKRYPDGVGGESFFEKNAPAHRPEWVTTAGGFVVAGDAPTLAWLGNQAAIELHAPLHHIDGPPRSVVFDLDPGAGADAVQCARVALLLRGMFEHLGLTSLVKTSGSKGLQVYVPLNDGAATYAATKAFAKAVAELLAAEEPALVVARQTKALRGGKVLVDWSQNDVHKTTVSVYSPRARERPTVSTPLRWEEVEAARDAADLVFDLRAVRARIELDGDLFAPLNAAVQRLPG